MRADWVFRTHSINSSTGVQADSLGTYGPVQVLHNTGPAAAQSHILYDSHEQLGTSVVGGVQNPAGTPIRVVSRAARAEAKRATILAVRGCLIGIPDGWIQGNVMALGMRLGAWEQDMTGVFSIDGVYSMWVENNLTPFERVAHWANFRRTNRWERRWTRAYNAETLSPIWTIPIFWKGRATLEPNECWGLYTEMENTSSRMRIQYWLSTLVADEG